MKYTLVLGFIFALSTSLLLLSEVRIKYKETQLKTEFIHGHLRYARNPLKFSYHTKKEYFKLYVDRIKSTQKFV